ncbi:MAG: hypothetical protein ACRDSJ_24615 [Rubrobacteraceae bacterium]
MSHVSRHTVVAAAALAAIGVGWTAYADGVARAAGAANDGILTVEECVGGGASLAGVLIEAGAIEEGLVRTEVSTDMCDEIRGQSSGGTSTQKLIAAQSYVREIELVEGAMRGAAETADRRFAGSLPSTELVSYGSPATEAQYDDEGLPVAGEESVGEIQYEPPEPSPGRPDAPLNSPQTEQAVEILDVAQEGGTIAERWERKRDAGIMAGATPPEAAAGARCSLELDLLDGTSATLYRGMFRIDPMLPEEMTQGDTATLELSVSAATKEIYKELERQYEEAAEVSEVADGCVGLTRRMKAVLIGQPHFEIVAQQGEDASVRPVVGDTVWSWDITAAATGSHPLHLNLGHELEQDGDQAFNFVSPALFDDTVMVKATLRQRAVGFVGGNWQWLWTAILVPIAVFLWSKRGRRRNDGDG